MKALNDYNVAAKQFATHPVGVIKIEAMANNAAVGFWQVFDSASVPAEGSVPVKSWPATGGVGDYKEFKRGELRLVNGLYVCFSTTAGTKTLGTGNNKFDVVSVELYDPEKPTGTTIAGDLTTLVALLQVWADVNGPKKLIRVQGAATAATVMYLQIHSVNSASLVSGTTKPIFMSKQIAVGASFDFNFGADGFDTSMKNSSLVINDACTIAVSTTPDVFTSPGASEFTIQAEYK